MTEQRGTWFCGESGPPTGTAAARAPPFVSPLEPGAASAQGNSVPVDHGGWL